MSDVTEQQAPPLTIQEFLEARWAQDEAAAHAAPSGSWFSALETGDDAENFGSVYTSHTTNWADAKTVADWYMPGAGYHIARHDPARVLAEIAAKKEILRLHGGDDTACQSWAGNYVWTPCQTLLALASPYRDHPDFREEWR